MDIKAECHSQSSIDSSRGGIISPGTIFLMDQYHMRRRIEAVSRQLLAIVSARAMGVSGSFTHAHPDPALHHG